MIHLNLSGNFAYNEDLFNYLLLFSQTIGTGINLFTLFIIFVYKGPEMRSYRWHLFLYQLFSTILDFSMDTLAQPIFFFPHMAGTAQGLLRTVFGMPTFTVYTTMMTVGGFCLHFNCFSPLYYRWQMVVPESSILKFSTKRKRLAFQIVHIIHIPALYFILDMSGEPVDEALRDFADHNPSDSFLTQVPGFYAINTWKNKLVLWSNIWILIILGWLFSVIALMAGSCIYSLNSVRDHMSLSTRKMHIRFLKNILFQSSVPLLLLEFPVVYWFACVFLNLRFTGQQNVTNLSVFCTCIHGAFGSILVFYLNPSYRRYLLEKFNAFTWKIFGMSMVNSADAVVGLGPSAASTSGLYTRSNYSFSVLFTQLLPWFLSTTMIRLNLSGDFVYNEDLFNYGLLFSQTIGTTINLLTLFTIYSYRGPEMRSYRVHLFLYQLFSTILDFSMDTMAQPVFFFPHMAGSAQGWLRTKFGMSTFTVYTAMMTFGGLCLHFICFSPLYYRWQMVLPEHSIFKFSTERKRLLFQLTQFLLSPLLYFGLDLPYEPTQQAKKDFADLNPDDAFLIQVPGFYALNSRKNQLVFWSNMWTLSLLIWLFGMVIFMSFSCAHSLNAARVHMSMRTREMHIRFLKNIFFQSGVPMLLLEFPVFYWLFSIMFDIRFPGHQNVTNLSVFCTCIHGAFGSIIVFYLNPSYRTYATQKFNEFTWKLFGISVVNPEQPHLALVSLSSSTSSTGL